MTNITMKVETLHIDTNPYGFYIFSYDYFKAAQSSSNLDFGKRTNYPAYFLYCRSLELIIKSILLATKKYKSKDLAMRKIFSHDILKGLKLLEKDAPDNLIKISSDDKKMINNLNKWYGVDGAGKKFEYYGLLTGMEVFKEETIKRGEYPELPSLKDLERLFDKFLNPRIVKYITAA
jgi:hypothetical protein